MCYVYYFNGKEKYRDSPSTASFPKCLQYPELGQPKVRSPELHWMAGTQAFGP